MTDILLPGERLAKEREKRGMSENEASDALKISRTYLRALEADDYEHLPEPAFVKGYLRNYAKLLGLPEQEITDAYLRLLSDKSKEEESASDSDSPGKTRTDTVVIDEKGNKSVLWVLLVVAAVIILLSWWQLQGERQPMESGETSPAVTSLPEDTLETETVPETVLIEESPADSDVTVTESAAVTESTDVLVLGFSQDCWLEVHDQQGERVFSGEQAAGSQLSVAGDAPFSITLGNSVALERVILNDSEQPVPSGTPGQVLRVSVP